MRFADLLSGPCLRVAWLRQKMIRAIRVAGMWFAGGMARDSAVYRSCNGIPRCIRSISRTARPALSRRADARCWCCMQGLRLDSEAPLSTRYRQTRSCQLHLCSCTTSLCTKETRMARWLVARGRECSVPPRTLVSWGWGEEETLKSRSRAEDPWIAATPSAMRNQT
jgi:hypothetical protein